MTNKKIASKIKEASALKMKKLAIVEATSNLVADAIERGARIDPGNLFKKEYNRLAMEAGIKTFKPMKSLRKVDYDEVVKLYKSGLGTLEISEDLEITRISVYRILNQKGVKLRGRELLQEKEVNV